MDKKRLEGIEKLHAQTKLNNKDLNAFIKIEEEYQLGYNPIVEFLDKNIAHKMNILHSYCHLTCLSSLYMLKNKSKYLDKDLTNEEIVRIFAGLDKKDATDLVKVTDKRNAKEREEFATRFAHAFKYGFKELLNLNAVTDKTLQMSDTQKFIKAFECGWVEKDIIEDLFGSENTIN